MRKTIWRVNIFGKVKDFPDLPKAKKYLRQYTKGDIIQVDGVYKRLAYFLSHGRLYIA